MAAVDRKRWNTKYEQGNHSSYEPSSQLTELEESLPTAGQALDVAGGAGRNAIWLAKLGLDVTVADISDVALGIAGSRAEQVGVTFETLHVDLEADGLPIGQWQLVACVHFLSRPLFTQLPEMLAPGGTFVCVHPTRSNLQRNAKPPERFLLEDGELPNLVSGLDVVHYNEGWSSENRHEAVIVARAVSESATKA